MWSHLSSKTLKIVYVHIRTHPPSTYRQNRSLDTRAVGARRWAFRGLPSSSWAWGSWGTRRSRTSWPMCFCYCKAKWLYVCSVAYLQHTCRGCIYYCGGSYDLQKWQSRFVRSSIVKHLPASLLRAKVRYCTDCPSSYSFIMWPKGSASILSPHHLRSFSQWHTDSETLRAKELRKRKIWIANPKRLTVDSFKNADLVLDRFRPSWIVNWFI